MVIEKLTFKVDRDDREAWLSIEEQTWSRYLEQRPGFVKKEIWVDPENPDEIIAMIWWESKELWYTIPQSDIERVDAKMGTWFREGVMRTYEVIREC